MLNVFKELISSDYNVKMFNFRKSIDLLKKVKGKHSIDQVYDKDDGVETAKKMKASLDEELRQVIILNGNSL